VQNFSWQQAAISLAGCLAGVCVLHFLGRLMVGRGARDVATAIGQAHSILGAAEHAAHTRQHQEIERLRHEAETRTEALHQRWTRAVEEAAEMRKLTERRLDEKWSRASAKSEQLLRLHRDRLQRDHDEQASRLESETETERKRFEESRSTRRS